MNCTTLENIFAERAQTDNQARLIVMLEYCTNCEIRERDSLPQNICGPCIAAVKSAFEFKMRCEQSQQYFRELLSAADQKPNIEELSTGDWCLTESHFKEDFCIKNEPVNLELCAEELNETKTEDYSVYSEGSAETSGNHEQFNCHLCSAQFRAKAYLGNHMRKHTNELMDYKCQHCPKTFARNWHLTRHISVVHGEKTFQCPQCQKCFAKAFSLRLHSKIHSKQTQFKCSQCPKIFAKEFLLQRHIQRVHVGPKPHSCPTCSKCFVSVRALQKHLPQHSDARPYKCDQCPRAFKSSDVLRGHMVKHSDERPFECAHCPMAFKLPFHLKRHIQVMHNKEKDL
ncbi:hypothetical protein ACLKA7_005384 [Drosophila subpalustris]